MLWLFKERNEAWCIWNIYLFSDGICLYSPLLPDEYSLYRWHQQENHKDPIELCSFQYRPNFVIETDDPYAEVIVIHNLNNPVQGCVNMIHLTAQHQYEMLKDMILTHLTTQWVLDVRFVLGAS